MPLGVCITTAGRPGLQTPRLDVLEISGFSKACHKDIRALSAMPPCCCSLLLGHRVASKFRARLLVSPSARHKADGPHRRADCLGLVSLQHVTLSDSHAATCCVAGPAKKKLGIQQKKKAMKSKSETYKIYSKLSAPPRACLPAGFHCSTQM